MTAVRRLITILSLLLATAAVAQQPATPAAAPQTPRATEQVTADTDRDVSDARALRLSLADAIQTSLKQNLGVELQRFSTLQSGQSLVAQYGVFDPLASANLSRSSDESATFIPGEAQNSGSTSANVALSQFLPTGGDYTVSFSTSRTTSASRRIQTINNQQAVFSVESEGYPSGLGFTFNQPLARNFGIDINRRGIYVARNTLGISREQFRTELLNTTHAVEQAYYDLIYARQFVDVLKEALFLARDQARITQIRIDVGASAPLDILQPRVQIATSEGALIGAVASVRSAEDRLRALLNLPQSEWDRPIVPTDTVRYEPFSIDFASAVARAYELRPEIKQDRLLTENARIQAVYARNQALPQFDARLGYNLAGTAGNSSVTNESAPWSRSLRQIVQFEFPGWNVGLNIGVPVFNYGARAEARRSRLDYDRSRTFEEQTRQNIAVEVRTTARAIDTAAKEITTSRAEREAAEQNLDAERKRYENGMTTNFQVLQVQQQLSDARARELDALVTYRKAIAAYHRAVGDLLETRNISLDEPPMPSEPVLFSRWDRISWLHYGNELEGENEDK